MEPPPDICPSCGSTSVQLTVEWSEPVVLDGEVMVTSILIDGRCTHCGADYDTRFIDPITIHFEKGELDEDHVQ